MKTAIKALLFMLTLVLLSQCEKKNQPPNCKIIAPLNNTSFDRGDKITISVEASDPDGTISEVRFYKNNTGISSSQSFPYAYIWDTSDDEPGIYEIKAGAIDSQGSESTDEINVSLSILATITTLAVTQITDISATCGGNITDGGGAIVTSRGVCWNTSTSPTLMDDHTDNGTGTGNFTSSITELTSNTTYYVRTYATNRVGTSYGGEVSFTTLTTPTLTTTAISSITESSSESGGNVTDNGGASVTARGVCWSNSLNPTITDDFTADGTGMGSFTSSLTGLTSNTTYYVRAYATNNVGTAYGNEISFSTPGKVTDFDNNVYETVRIGDQTWMAENLKTTHYADGTPLVNGTSANDITDDYSTKYWFEYGNKTTYGLLYTWAAAMNGAASSDNNPSGLQGVCPDGWHLPSDSEWKELEIYLGMSQSETNTIGSRGTTEGGKLKETGTTHWNSPNGGATNESGFSALPSGWRYGNGNYEGIGTGTAFWVSTENDALYGWSRLLLHRVSTVYRYGNYVKYNGFSVRCVMDD